MLDGVALTLAIAMCQEAMDQDFLGISPNTIPIP